MKYAQELAARYEKSIIGIALQNPATLDDMAILLEPQHFGDIYLGKVFAALCDTRASGGLVSRKTAIDAMQRIFLKTSQAAYARAATEDEVDSFRAAYDSFLTSCTDADRMPAAHLRYCADKIIEEYRRREILEAAQRLTSDIGDRTLEVSDVIANLTVRMEQIESMDSDNDTTDLSKAIHDVRAVASKSDELAYVRTGITSLDNMTGAIVAGTLTIIAARPGVGKTLLGMQIALTNADLGKSVLFASLEMSTAMLAERVIASRTKLIGEDIRRRRLEKPDLNQISALGDELTDTPFVIYAPIRATVAAITARARIQATSPTGLSCLIVDYLGIIHGTGGKQERRDELGDMAKQLRETGKELGIPVFLLAQLNRQATKAKPTGSQIADSDQPQRHADIVILIDDADEGFSIIVDKNRTGITGTIDVNRDGARGLFSCSADKYRGDFGQF